MILSLLGFFSLFSSDIGFYTSAPARIIHQKNPQAYSPEMSAERYWEGYFSAQKFENNVQDRLTLLHLKRNLRKAMTALPRSHAKYLKNLEIRNLSHPSRGMANREKIILHNPSISTDQELIAVFIHEMGHIVDLSLLEGKTAPKSNFKDGKKAVPQDDPSVIFYEISWQDSENLKENIRPSDFVSGYAMSNPFEDFAESYTFYRLHGEKFREKMTSSIPLQKKYHFLKNFVFYGKEYQLEKENTSYEKYLWDTTLLSFESL